MSDKAIIEFQQGLLSVERIDEDEIDYVETLHQRNIITDVELKLYHDYVNSGYNPEEYRSNPHYSEKRGGIDLKKIFEESVLAKEFIIVKLWFDSLKLNHAYKSMSELGKEGIKEFFAQAMMETKRPKKEITSTMKFAQIASLNQAIQLNRLGIQMTTVMKLAAVENASEIVEELIEEGVENKTKLTASVVNEFIENDEYEEESVLDEILEEKKPKPEPQSTEEVEEETQQQQLTIFDAIDKSKDDKLVENENQNNFIDVDYSVLPQRESYDKNFEKDKEEIIEQFEINTEEFDFQKSLPKGCVYIAPEQTVLLRQWFQRAANKHGPKTVRGKAFRAVLKDLTRFIPELEDELEGISLGDTTNQTSNESGEEE